MSHKGSVIIFELSAMHIKSKCLSETVVVFHELCRIVPYPLSKNVFIFTFPVLLGLGGSQKFNQVQGQGTRIYMQHFLFLLS